MIENSLYTDPLPTNHMTLGDGVKIQINHGHVVYQIKGNHESSNMGANMLPADPPPPRP